jgi:hypothetical protein
MVISNAQQSSIVERLVHDVAATLGRGHETIIRHHAINLARFVDDPDCYRKRLVEEVQQYIHDCFIDTTWPRCPDHSNHPLWLHGDFWCCERDDRKVAKLGELVMST